LADSVKVRDKPTKIIHILIPETSNNIQSEIMNIKIIIAFQFAYIVFLMAFTHMVAIKTEEKPSVQELYAAIYIWTLACELIREFISSESFSLRYGPLLFLLVCTQFQFPVYILTCSLLFQSEAVDVDTEHVECL
jgi:hypothetical protein